MKPLEPTKVTRIDKQELKKVFEKYGFNSLLVRLANKESEKVKEEIVKEVKKSSNSDNGQMNLL